MSVSREHRFVSFYLPKSQEILALAYLSFNQQKLAVCEATNDFKTFKYTLRITLKTKQNTTQHCKIFYCYAIKDGIEKFHRNLTYK